MSTLAVPSSAQPQPSDHLSENDRRVSTEFTQLLSKSKELFNSLRDLPQCGNKHWQHQFGKTFDLFTFLWKYQQQHRRALDIGMGLQRWQIGELASKIGQLYYHYYLRTSDTSYLLEAFSFYSAIRSRQYYSQAAKADTADLMVKKLRYFARFIVVCLLLKKLKLVRDLIRELTKQVEDYVTIYDPQDQLDWTLVLQELRGFVDADNLVNVIDVDSSTVILSHRLTPYCVPPAENTHAAPVVLQEALIIGNNADQVKFSELTLDMFWMLQTLEREPRDDVSANASDSSPALGRTPNADPTDGHRTTDNPHKYLLYKATFSQIMLFLSTAFKELPSNAAILMYISGNSSFVDPGRPQTGASYDFGGILTHDRRERAQGSSHRHDGHSKHDSNRNAQCLYPGDLYPFLRKPFFLIVESDNSSVFLNMPNLFRQPGVTLASPEEVPPYLAEQPRRGSILTLFLHSPLTAFCYICNITNIPIALWDKCQAHTDRFLAEAGRLLLRSPKVDRSYVEFYTDDFLRLLMLRFVFAQTVLRLHRAFRDQPHFRPHSYPPLPDADLLMHPVLRRLVCDLSSILDVMSAFRDNEETVC